MAPTGQFADVLGTTTKHHLGINSEGVPINAKTVSASVSEYVFAPLNYPFRDNEGRVALKGHLVRFTDSHGDLVTYKVSEQFPDEKLGLIVLILIDNATPVRKDNTCAKF